MSESSSEKIWIIASRESNDEKVMNSCIKILESLNNNGISSKDARIVFNEDLTMRIETNGLSLYEGDTIVRPPLVVLTRIHSGCMSFDFHVTLLIHLELMGVIVCNPSKCVVTCTNKVLHLAELALHNIPLATTLSYSSKSLDMVNTKLVEQELKSPVIVKSVHGNRGNKVFLLPQAEMMEEMKGILNHDVPYLFQHYVKESHGRDMRVIVINNECVFAMIRSSNSNSVKANLSQGGTGEIVTGKYPDAEALAVRISKILKMDLAGVDLLFSNEHGYVCCEVNNCPAFTLALSLVATKIAQMLISKLPTYAASSTPTKADTKLLAKGPNMASTPLSVTDLLTSTPKGTDYCSPYEIQKCASCEEDISLLTTSFDETKI
jgi:RimK family alpha-L-glutamate ligase